jgi:hypothetical protein
MYSQRKAQIEDALYALAHPMSLAAASGWGSCARFRSAGIARTHRALLSIVNNNAGRQEVMPKWATGALFFPDNTGKNE